MGFLAPFIIGLVAGGVAMLQFTRRVGRGSDAMQPSNIVEQRSVNKEPHPVAQVDSTDPPIEPQPDRLETIRGIGPIYAQRLNRAGIRSFAQLAALGPAQLTAIVSEGKSERLIDVQTWLDQAQQLANTQTI